MGHINDYPLLKLVYQIILEAEIPRKSCFLLARTVDGFHEAWLHFQRTRVRFGAAVCRIKQGSVTIGAES